MKTRSPSFRNALFVSLALGAMAAFAACGGNGGDTSSSSGESSSGISPVTSSSGSGGGSSASSSGSGGGGGGSGCFNGAPMTQPQFLNACTTADCAPFNTPLPLLKQDGTLPQLP